MKDLQSSKRSATQVPNTIVIVAFILSGCSDTGSTDAGSIGESIGKNVTEFAQGVGTGVDTQMQISIELSQPLLDAGVTHTVAKQQTSLDEPEKAVTIYFVASQPLAATLLAKAYNSDNQEIGRALTDVQFSKDDAQYITFKFPSEMDRQTVALYRIDIRDSQ